MIHRRPPAFLLIFAGLALLIGVGAWQFTHRAAAPDPPAPNLANADSGVVSAIQTARDSARRAPRNPAAWGQLGMVLFAHDYRSEANACFQEAERLQPGNPRWPYLHGQSLSIDAPDAALPLLEHAATLAGNAPPAPRLAFAEALFERGKLPEAAAQFQAVLAASPANSRALLGLGRCALAAGENTSAIEYLRRSAEMTPEIKAAHALLATALQRAGRKAEAGEQLRLAGPLPEAPSWPDPYLAQAFAHRAGERGALNQGEDLAQKGRNPELVSLMRETVKRYPKSARAWALLGRGLTREREFPEAEAALRTALQLAPDSIEAQNQLGSVLLLENRPSEAAACYQQVLKLQPNLAEAHVNLGLCRLSAGRNTEAAAEFREAAREKPNLIDAPLGLARALLASGRRAEAYAAAEAAAGINSSDPRLPPLLEGTAPK